MLNALLPTPCGLCRSKSAEMKDGLCGACSAKLVPTIGEGVLHLGDYQTLDMAVRALKFFGRRELAAAFAKILAQGIQERAWPLDAIVPVPLHWLRRFERGYNQSELLAKVLAKQFQLPVLRALRRVRSTKRQTNLPRTQRLKNVEAAFVLNPKISLRGKNILLIDDVYTTGATMRECEAVLKNAGAFVHIAVVAKA